MNKVISESSLVLVPANIFISANIFFTRSTVYNYCIFIAKEQNSTVHEHQEDEVDNYFVSIILLLGLTNWRSVLVSILNFSFYHVGYRWTTQILHSCRQFHNIYWSSCWCKPRPTCFNFTAFSCSVVRTGALDDTIVRPIMAHTTCLARIRSSGVCKQQRTSAITQKNSSAQYHEPSQVRIGSSV